jgi:crotonobetainyl-CoA:carnitine CoA-transferase CaiB-like acyl-CoA transferase
VFVDRRLPNSSVQSGMVVDVPNDAGCFSGGIASLVTLWGKAESILATVSRVGEQSSAVLRDSGFNDAEIASLIDAQVVEQLIGAERRPTSEP